MTVTLDQNLYALSPYGPVQPTTLQGPVRQGLGKYGDGLFVEEGTTNLVLNPTGNFDLTNFGSVGASFTITRDTTRLLFGVASYKVVMNAAGADSFSLVVASMVAAQAHWGSAYIYFPSSGGPTAGGNIYTDVQGAAAYDGPNYAANASVKDQWQRIGGVATPTTTGAGTIRIVTSGANVGTFWVAAFQVEQKGYATSYCDGSLATAWNATGNLLPSAAQSYEDGTTAGATVAVGTATLSNSAAQVYAGTKSLLATVTATAALAVLTGATGTSGAPVTAGKTYTGAQWVRPSAARNLECDINWYTAAGAFISTSFGTTFTGVANTWTRQSVSAVAPATAAFATLQFNSGNATNGDLYYIDAQRISEGTDAAAYRWTGAENASTSTRTAGQVAFPNPGVADGYTAACLARIGYLTATQTNQFITTNNGSDNSGLEIQYYGPSSTFYLGVANGGDARAQVASALSPGDLVFLAFTRSGSTTTAYVSKNGAALTTATVTVAAVTTTANPFRVGGTGSSQAFGGNVIEQALVYNRVLTSTEIAALAASTAETNYSSDPGIVLAAGTGVVRGTTTAETAAGTGYYRSDRTMKCYVETLTKTGANPDDDTATVKITVPAGSGIGVGQLVAVNYPLSSFGLTVQRVFSPGGDYDEIYAA
jgi:hypothetical protein